MVQGSKLYRSLISSAAALSILTIGATALAADDDDDDKKKDEEAPKPKPRRRERAPEARGDTDHSMVVGHLGVGYFGTASTFAAPALATLTGAPKPISMPLVGVRYWLQDSLGLDVAIGINHQSGSASSGGTSNDSESWTGVAVYGGLPIVFFTAKHYNFFLEPFISLAHASHTPAAPTTDSDSSTVVQVGGKIGTEISFGFIGIPHLTLDATVGLQINYESDTQSPGGGASDNTLSSTTIGTTLNGEPWNIFTSNINAVYYF
jgi:hypothetical protein